MLWRERLLARICTWVLALQSLLGCPDNVLERGQARCAVTEAASGLPSAAHTSYGELPSTSIRGGRHHGEAGCR